MNQTTLNYTIGDSLKGKILISPPNMLDNRFFNTVILITSHDSNGAVGIIINKKSAHLLHHIITNLDKTFDIETINIANKDISIVLGGPMHPNSIFILHSTDYQESNSIAINSYLYMTNKPDLILKLANNQGPQRSIIAIGCAIWSPLQLEKELENYGWLVAEYSNDFIKNNIDNLYDVAMNNLGIDNSNYALFLHNNQN